MEKDKIISFDNEFQQLGANITKVKSNISDVSELFEETDALIEELYAEMTDFPGMLRVIEGGKNQDSLDELNHSINEIVVLNFKQKGDLNIPDVLVSTIAGAVAAAIDILLVGTPEVVTIYRGGERFDGSVLTGILRKYGNGDDQLSSVLHWFCERCKVPYDISCVKNVANPNNHRLRNFGHDPLIGLLFAVADIIMGTATFVDSDGKLRVVVNPKDYPDTEKYLAVIYYLGHLLSDVCTARGLPIPGFVLTQFFTNDGNDDSIAVIAERMYRDGYDLRHLASMSVPVVVKDVIITAYLSLSETENQPIVGTIAQKELEKQHKEIRRAKMLLVSDAVACGGNVAKFFLPPTMGNMTALNLPEWMALLRDGVDVAVYQMRDKSTELVVSNREVINQNWNILLKDE